MKINKIEYAHGEITVFVEGYEETYLPHFQLDEIKDKNDFISKLKAKLQEIDNLKEPEPEVIPQKHKDLKELEGILI